eukprot:Lithocolla_globosa_v1_NODE_6982_length_1007_cov_5.961134.p1 type:complete len:254 gc:universal NODE_6982_length_1007_cov_5.961134:207-968(+)
MAVRFTSLLCRSRSLPPTSLVRSFSVSARLGSQHDQKERDEIDQNIVNNKERILTVPNLLSLSRLVACPFIAYFVAFEQPELALGTFMVSGATDFVDGYIARKWNQTSVFGTVLDPFSDKVCVITTTSALMLTGALSFPVGCVILGRDVFFLGSGFVLRYRSVPPPVTWAKYWDFQMPTAEVRPSNLSKLNTAFQVALLTGCLAEPVFGFPAPTLLQPLGYVTATTTIASAVMYLANWRSAIYIYRDERTKEK